MERENQTTHPSGEHVPVRDGLEVLPARHALRVVVDGERGAHETDLSAEAGLSDLSVPVERKRPLMRSGWAAVIEVTFRRSDPARNPQLYAFVGTRLRNRTAVIGVSDDDLRIDFQVENCTPKTQATVRIFAEQLRHVIGAEADHVEYRINDLDPNEVDAVLGGERPDLRAL